MGIKPSVLFARMMHRRLFPQVNGFAYGIYYLAFPLGAVEQLPLSNNRFGAMSFHDSDHGACDGSALEPWARNVLAAYGVTQADGEIVLVCMPRVLGYVFNPVSFWLCCDRARELRAVLCQVHNTFGERHTYLCAHADGRPIALEDTLRARKVFHVSPMLRREGHYRFRFKLQEQTLSVRIDFHNARGQKQLVTALNGRFEPMTQKSLRKAFWIHPLVTLKAIVLIHWQALRLFVKGARPVSRPPQLAQRVSATENLAQKSFDSDTPVSCSRE